MELKENQNKKATDFFRKSSQQEGSSFVEIKNLNEKKDQKIRDMDNKLKENKLKLHDFGNNKNKTSSSKSRETVVLVERLKKNFVVGGNNIEVLKGVDVEIKKGDFAMLIGPSGCGKSTLLHIIYGLEKPTEGKVFIKGDDIWSHNKNWRANFRNSSVGFIPQQAFWLKSLNVLENVAMPAVIGGIKFYKGLEKAAEMLDMVGMADWAHHRPYDLSGGQQQRVALARALSLNPWLVIADEPTGNLDQKSGTELINLIQDLNQRFGLTILMVTHNQDQFQYATKVVKVVDGLIVQE